jgi:Tol biopolymer transport system component
MPICSVRPGAGITGTWGADGQILFASIEGDGIFRVSTAGGEPVLERERQPDVQRVVWPSFLPDGKRYLYLVRKPDRTYRIMLAEAGGPPREVRTSDSFAQYVAPGYLVFAREGALLAQRFDATSGRVEGEPVAIADPVASFATVGWASFAVSAHGVLAYASPGNRASLSWFDRAGRGEALESAASMLWVRFSPDGKSALFNRPDPRTGNLDIWSLDLTRRVESRLTSHPDTESYGLLLPDGSLVYSDPIQSSPQLVRRNPATGETRVLAPLGGFQVAQDLTPDGRTLIYAERPGTSAWDLFQVSLAGGPPEPILATPFTETDLRLSPYGRFATFVSDESGRREVYVSPFPNLAQKTRVTQEGGHSPHWSLDGRELFYITDDRRVVAVPVRTGASIELGTPKTLFAIPGKYRWAGFDVAPDGRFLAIVPESLASEQPLTVVVNWMAGLGAPQSR